MSIYAGSNKDSIIGSWCGLGSLTDLQSPTNAAIVR